mmetsp:Transcript_61338/g.146082  ORF Transcript_61338/g.146082 Transcript_61338/m.146082 type:complete len:274 (+) Transcript_61338:91-912(+)
MDRLGFVAPLPRGSQVMRPVPQTLGQSRPHLAHHMPRGRVGLSVGRRVLSSSSRWSSSLTSGLFALCAFQALRRRHDRDVRCHAQRRRRKTTTPTSTPSPSSSSTSDDASPTATTVAEPPVPKGGRRRRRRVEVEPIEDVKPMAADPIANLLEGEDPNFFGFPYLWVQNAHLILFFVAFGASLTGDVDDFILFGLPPIVEDALRPGLFIVVGLNVLVAANMAREEAAEGSNGFTIAGWFLKGLLLGGVANWQRLGRRRFQQQRGRKQQRQVEA